MLLVDAVFVLFLAAQAAAFFGGHDYIQRATGLTYAEYVHQGFAQLTFATVLTLLVVWAARARPATTPADRWWLRGSLGALCAADPRGGRARRCTGWTSTRRPTASPGCGCWSTSSRAGSGLVVVAVMVAGHPAARLVAAADGAALRARRCCWGWRSPTPTPGSREHNVERYQATGKVDWSYLRGLSADAAPDAGGAAARQAACALGGPSPERTLGGVEPLPRTRRRRPGRLRDADRRGLQRGAVPPRVTYAGAVDPEADALLDSLPDGVVVADAEGTVTLVNDDGAAAARVRPRSPVGHLRDVMALQDQESCEWYATNTPYDGLGSRVGLTEQSWLTADGTEVLVTGRINRHRPVRTGRERRRW